jgi:hypothetical protein
LEFVWVSPFFYHCFFVSLNDFVGFVGILITVLLERAALFRRFFIKKTRPWVNPLAHNLIYVVFTALVTGVLTLPLLLPFSALPSSIALRRLVDPTVLLFD